jgi:hypothetical protein
MAAGRVELRRSPVQFFRAVHSSRLANSLLAFFRQLFEVYGRRRTRFALVIVLDQFEELFTRFVDPERRGEGAPAGKELLSLAELRAVNQGDRTSVAGSHRNAGLMLRSELFRASALLWVWPSASYCYS